MSVRLSTFAHRHSSSKNTLRNSQTRHERLFARETMISIQEQRREKRSHAGWSAFAVLRFASDGDGIIIDDNLFTICPWWDGPSVREKLELQLAADAQRRAGFKWIWIHHAPPANAATSWSGRQSFGDKDLVQWIEDYSPDIVFSGHVHQSPFVQNGSGRISWAKPGALTPDTNLDRRQRMLHWIRTKKKPFGFLQWAYNPSSCSRHCSGRYRRLRDFQGGSMN